MEYSLFFLKARGASSLAMDRRNHQKKKCLIPIRARPRDVFRGAMVISSLEWILEIAGPPDFTRSPWSSVEQQIAALDPVACGTSIRRSPAERICYDSKTDLKIFKTHARTLVSGRVHYLAGCRL